MQVRTDAQYVATRANALASDLATAAEVLQGEQEELEKAHAALSASRSEAAALHQELSAVQREVQQRAAANAAEVGTLRAQRDQLAKLYDETLTRALHAENRACDLEAHVQSSEGALNALREELDSLSSATDTAVAAARQAGREESAPRVAALEARLYEEQQRCESLRNEMVAAHNASRAESQASAEAASRAARAAEQARERAREEADGAARESEMVLSQAREETVAAHRIIAQLRSELQSARDGNDDAVSLLLRRAHEKGAVDGRQAIRGELELPLAVCAALHRALGTAISLGRLAEAYSRMPLPDGGSHNAASRTMTRTLIKRCVRAMAMMRSTCHAALARGEGAAQNALSNAAEEVVLGQADADIIERAIVAAKDAAAAATAHAAARAVAHERVNSAGGPFWIPMQRPPPLLGRAQPSPQRSPSPKPARRASPSHPDSIIDKTHSHPRPESPLRVRLEHLRAAAREALVELRPD